MLEVAPVHLAIFIFCLVGCGIHSFIVGRNSGIVSALEYLADAGYIDLEEDDND